MIAEHKLPIAETFHSIQGEGMWTGAPMHFVRLAGCTVGRPASASFRTNAKGVEPFPILPSGRTAWGCATFDGRAFWCDTDFNKYGELMVSEILKQTREKHICLTGGEPLMHLSRLREDDFFFRARERRIQIHIETSGTIEYSHDHLYGAWVTVAPKQGYLPRAIEMASEVKLLVDAKFTEETIPAEALRHRNVWLCPINGVLELDPHNVNRCLTLLDKFPHWRISVQLHKVLGVR